MNRSTRLLLGLLLAACQSPVYPRPGRVQVQEMLAADVTEGTARLLGRAFAPVPVQARGELVEAPVRGGVVELRDASGGSPTATTSVDAAGEFILDNVPRGAASLVRVVYASAGSQQAIEQLVFPTTSAHCARIDLASTLLVDRLRREDRGPVAPPPGQSHLERVRPEAMDPFETGIREALRRAKPEAIAVCLPVLGLALPDREDDLEAETDETGSSPLDGLMGHDEVRRRCDDLLVKSEASLVFRVASIGFNQGIPSDARSLSGKVIVTLHRVPDDVQQCQIWALGPIPRQLATLSPGQEWTCSLDLWPLPPGPNSLDRVALTARGRRFLARIPIMVDPSIARLCE